MTDYPGSLTLKDLNNLSKTILMLYRNSSRLAVDNFLTWAIESLTRIIYFDSGAMGHYTSKGLIPYNIYLHNQPEDLVTSYLKVQDLDPLFPTMLSINPGKTVNFDSLISKAEFNSHPLYIKHAKKFDIEYAISTRIEDPVTTHSIFLTLYRSNPEQPFTDKECQLMEFIFPHIVEAQNQNILLHLRKKVDVEESTSIGHALCDENGEIHIADPVFNKYIKQEWGDYTNIKNVKELRDLVITANKSSYKGKHIVIRKYQSDNLFHLMVHKRILLDTLSERETTVAKMISLGCGYKEVSNQLDISLSTVTTHMNNIYKKLGFKNKAELSYWISKTNK